VAAVLKALDFEVIDGLDFDKAAFDRKVRDFAEALTGSAAGVFFYAGHGLQVNGQNFLVPVDAKVDSEAALDFETVRVEVVQRAMERAASTNVLYLDACRDNPLARNLARAMGTRSAQIGRGLASIESGVGTLISFSTQPGNVALDGTGRNSPFAGALVRQLATSTDELSAILIAVRTGVMKETQRKQVPWEHSALTGRFYFNPAKAAPAPRRQESQLDRDWELVKDSTDAAVLQAFISSHKGTVQAALADARLRALEEWKSQPPAASDDPACLAVSVGFRVFEKEPPRGVGAVGYGEKVFVKDGECGAGFIKEIVGGSKRRGVDRKLRCVPCG
jgi:uncharacterized caspase-like protein